MISIITDSTACLPYKAASEIGVRVVPVTFTVAGRQYHESYLDLNTETDKLLHDTPGPLSTSHTSVAVFQDVFRNLTRNGNEVLCLVISSRLSGVFSSASVAARDTDPARIAVVDSRTTAGGLALLLREAKALEDKGLTLREIAEGVESKRKDVGIVFSVEDMAALRKSGRLGVVRQSVGTVLNVRPILALEDGVVASRGVSRGSAQLVKDLAGYIPAAAKSIVIHHYGDKSDPEQLLEAVRRRFPDADIAVRTVGPSLSIHLGTGLLAAAWIV
jgi:DegV family protein with EDD domain